MSEFDSALAALLERMDTIEEIVYDLGEDQVDDIMLINNEIKELKANMASVISMFTQMNISLLQIQNEILGNKDDNND